jgi:hypothetical protein
MQQNAQYRRLKITCSPGLAHVMKNFHRYCGIALYPRHKTPSICCAHPEPTPNYRRIMCSKEPTISIGSPGHHQAPEPLSLTPRKREHRGARAPSTHGTSAQPPNTTGATIFISRLQEAPVPPRKPPSIRNTAKSHEKLPWIRHAALPRTSSMPSKNYDNKTPHTQDATPLNCTSSPRFFRKRRDKL